MCLSTNLSDLHWVGPVNLHHLQTHPYSNADATSPLRRGNLPKRSFPYDNLGYGNSIAIPSAVHWKPDQMSYMVDFLDINNWNGT